MVAFTGTYMLCMLVGIRSCTYVYTVGVKLGTDD